MEALNCKAVVIRQSANSRKLFPYVQVSLDYPVSGGLTRSCRFHQRVERPDYAEARTEPVACRKRLRDTEQTGLVVKSVIDLVYVQSLVPQHVNKHARINGAAAGAHHETFEGRKAH
jgi:hypothetical protein